LPLTRFNLFEHTMDTLQSALYSRINNFNLDVAGVQLPFSQRLARENKWSEPYTLRVIEEYKKFTFLAMVAGHPVTPSQQVDAVWHLHLTYSQSYWLEFCPNILGAPLHHKPTQGGVDETKKFREWYGNTLGSYQIWFKDKPPADIWPCVDERFSCSTPSVCRNKRGLNNLQTSILLTSLFLVTSCSNRTQDSALLIFLVYIFLIFIKLRGSWNSRKSRSDWNVDSNDGSHGGFGDSDSGDSGCGGCGGD